MSGTEMKGASMNAREIAATLLIRTDVEDAYANLLLPKLLTESRLEERDRAFATELGYGTLRMLGSLDTIIASFVPDLNRVSTEVNAILRLGSYQLLFTRVPVHAAISETVNLCRTFKQPNATGFVNAVLRKVAQRTFLEHFEDKFPTPAEQASDAGLAFKFAHPEWIIRAFRESLTAGQPDPSIGVEPTIDIEQELQELLASNNEAAKVNLAQLVPLDEHERSSLSDKTVPNVYSPIGLQLQSSMPWSLAPVRSGKVRVQDEGSQLAALALIHALPIRESEVWADFCSGPGGKAAVLAAEANQRDIELVLNEVNPTRARLVEQAVTPVNQDAFISVADARDFGEEHPESFDRILLDAPCSGIGSLRRRPESRWRKTPAEIGKLLQLQSELINSAVASLKPEGILVYVTCSPHFSETIQQVNNVIKHHKLVALDTPALLQSFVKNPILQVATQNGSAQLWPHRHNTDAMFISVLQKSSADNSIR